MAQLSAPLLDDLRASAERNPLDVRARLRLAAALREAGRLEEATEEYLWLWKNMAQLEPAMATARGSLVLSEIHVLVSRHAGARRRFEGLRDELRAAPSFQQEPRDWVLLNRALGDDERSLEWWESIKNAPARRQALGHAGAMYIEHFLIGRERWADLGRLHPEPAAELEQRGQMLLRQVSMMEGMQPEMRDAMVEGLRKHFRTTAGQFVKGLRAAGREDDARRVSEIAVSLDPSSEMRSAVEKARRRGGLRAARN